LTHNVRIYTKSCVLNCPAAAANHKRAQSHVARRSSNQTRAQSHVTRRSSNQKRAQGHATRRSSNQTRVQSRDKTLVQLKASTKSRGTTRSQSGKRCRCTAEWAHSSVLEITSRLHTMYSIYVRDDTHAISCLTSTTSATITLTHTQTHRSTHTLIIIHSMSSRGQHEPTILPQPVHIF